MHPDSCMEQDQGNRLKWIIVLVFSVITFFSLNIITNFAQEEENRPILVTLNEQNLEFMIDPYLEQGTTLVQFRPLFEAMAIGVSWNQQEKRITGTKSGFLLEMQIDNPIAKVNGENIELLKAPQVIRGNTMVPIRFVSEATGALVVWNPYHPQIIIYTVEFMEANGVTREQVKEAIDQELERIKNEVEKQKQEEEKHQSIEPVPIPEKPDGSGVYSPASSDDIDLNALQGLYYGFVPDYGGFECGGICWKHYTFLPDQKLVVGEPLNGGPETIDCTKDECFTYTIKEGTLTLSNEDSYSIEVNEGQLVIDDVQLNRVKPVTEPNLKLTDTFIYVGYEGYVGIHAISTSWTETITFYENGTFRSDNMMLQSFNSGDTVTHGSSGSDVTGSYRIDRNTITLAYSNGEIMHLLFYIHEEDGSNVIDDIQIGENNYSIE